MNEKPVNARVANAIGKRVIQCGQSRKWFVKAESGDNLADPVPDYEHDIAAAFGALEVLLNDETVCCTITLMKDAASVMLTKSKSINDLSAKRIGVGENDLLPAAICQAIIAVGEKGAGRDN